jgi:hypothetical protein
MNRERVRSSWRAFILYNRKCALPLTETRRGLRRSFPRP